ncbi:hypothetical protein [Rhodococcus sp. ARC_M5]|uniref:hypothetical protein n=1 Tax=Rhodococcus sp. ARC_M5 TaxID=2928851 RepID=UPI001FB2A06F|nr:hypothetical protein [Rhodococcus sp. ARC_M5]
MSSYSAKIGAPKILVLFGLTLCLLFPFNAAAPDGLWQILALTVILSGICSFYLLLWRVQLSQVSVGIVTVGVLVFGTTGLLVPDRIVSVSLLVSSAAVGVAAATIPQAKKCVWTILGASMLVLSASFFFSFDLLVTTGIDLRVEYPNSGLFRATGVMGHPLLSAFVIVTLCCGLAAYYWASFRGFAILLILFSGTGAALFTGTRSAFITTAIVCLIATISSALTRKMSTVARTAYLLGVGSILTLTYFSSTLLTASQLRVFDFSELASEASFATRANTLSILQRAEASLTCTGVCEVTGRGFRRSTDYFATYSNSSLVRTFDNSYVTAYFDLGILGVALILFVLTLILRTKVDAGTKLCIFGVISLPAFFFDSIYSVGTVCASAFLLALVWGQVCAPARSQEFLERTRSI